MGCTRTAGCPLFPYLNESLGSWREAYCDSAADWRSCARYHLSCAGEPVPLALLPNGRIPVAMIPELSRAEVVRQAAQVGERSRALAVGRAGDRPSTEDPPSTQDPPPMGRPLAPTLPERGGTSARRSRPDPGGPSTSAEAGERALLSAVRLWRTTVGSRWARLLAWLRAPA